MYIHQLIISCVISQIDINQNRTDPNPASSVSFMSSNSVHMFSFWNQSIRKYVNDTIICIFFYLIAVLPFSSLFSELGLLSSISSMTRFDKRTNEKMLHGKTNIDNDHRNLPQTTAYLHLSPLFLFSSLSFSLSLFSLLSLHHLFVLLTLFIFT